MTVRIAAANSVAKMFRAAVRRMLSRRFTISNLPAAIDGGAARVRRSLFEFSRTGSTRASATDATHPRFNLRAYGRFRFDGNKAGQTKRDGRVANTHERRQYSASAKLRLSRRLPASARSNQNDVRLAPG